MGWLDFFKSNKEIDPLKDLTLSKLKVGYFVDYDMKTWEVTACNHYDWGSGDLTYEWQLKSADETIYLEREPDDEDYWCVSRRISIRQLGAQLADYIVEHGDPPEQIEYQGKMYDLDETGGGHFYQSHSRHESQEGKELLKWDYVDDSGELLLSIEQWGETEFEAAYGEHVEEYQFTNILPNDTGN